MIICPIITIIVIHTTSYYNLHYYYNLYYRSACAKLYYNLHYDSPAATIYWVLTGHRSRCSIRDLSLTPETPLRLGGAPFAPEVQ